MSIEEFIFKKNGWIKAEGPKSNIVMSTRVRLARNIKGHMYFNWADEKNRLKTLNSLINAFKKSNFLNKALFLKIKDLSDIDRKFLFERHLMSKEHMKEIENKALIVEKNEVLSIMLNEEDHIRFQVLQSGFNIMEAWRIVDRIDTEIEQYISFDYSSRFGYLTSCPTNTGTGLRASVMLHLSALAMSNQIKKVFDTISKLGLTIRGFYGEGTEALGDFFQISNQIALGYSEMEILDNLEKIITKIIIKEEEIRQTFLKAKKQEIEDKVFRAFGVLKNARIITSNETIKLLSIIRLGVDLGFIRNLNITTINEILFFVQPAHLQKINGNIIDSYERDVIRAKIIREKLAKI